MTKHTDQIEAARTALSNAILGRTGAQLTCDEAEKAHERATVVLNDAKAALQAIADRDAQRDASVAARLADAIRTGKPIAIDNDADGHAERLEAERRRSIAQQAADALQADVTAAALDLQAARNGVDAAAKAVLIAERDALVADLKEQTAAFLDARHRLMGLLDSRLVPSTADAAAAVSEVDRAYPPAMHPANAAARSWSGLARALVDDHKAAYEQTAPVAMFDPMAAHREALAKRKQADDAERAANAEKAATELARFTEADAMTARYERLLSGRAE
jgi:hypothetical protein